jgi:hypothetical protein
MILRLIQVLVSNKFPVPAVDFKTMGLTLGIGFKEWGKYREVWKKI